MKPYQLKNYRIVKEAIRQDTWCSAHLNCFRCSFGPGESDEHRDKKYELFCKWRKAGFHVIVEGILKNGMRPDLICFSQDEIFIQEIINTESKESIIKKKKEYPFPVFTIELKRYIKKDENP